MMSNNFFFKKKPQESTPQERSREHQKMLGERSTMFTSVANVQIHGNVRNKSITINECPKIYKSNFYKECNYQQTPRERSRELTTLINL